MKITREHLRRLIREEKERLLESIGSNDEMTFRRAVDDFVMDHMNTMNMNAGDSRDRERIRSTVERLVSVQLDALGLGE